MSSDNRTIKKNQVEQVDQPKLSQNLYTTPIKPNKSKLQYFYHSHTFKNIADHVRQNTERKFKQLFNQNGSYYVFRSQLKQINRILPLEKPSQLLNTSIKLYQVIQINRKMRRIIQSKVTYHQALRINLINKLQRLQKDKKKLRQRKIQLQKLKVKNKSINILGDRALQLKEQQNSIFAAFKQKQSTLHDLNASVYNLQIRRQKTDNYMQLLSLNIQEQLQLMNQLNLEQKTLEVRALNRQTIKISNSKDIVYCMFLVGILRQQLFILGNQKSKQKMKELNKGNINHKLQIQNKLTNRTIKLQCHNSNIIHFQIFTAIYMHAKSLLINNLYFIMNRISFFSEDFQHLYDYHLFEIKFQTLIHKLMSNQIYSPHNYKQIIQQNDNKNRKILIIMAQKEHIRLTKWILQQIMMNEGNLLNMQGYLIEVKLIEIGLENQISFDEANILKLELQRLDLNNYL